MANTTSVTGLGTVLRNLAAHQARLGAGAHNGLKLAGRFLQRESQRKVPVDTGNLKGSAYTRAFGIGLGTTVAVGYTAAYALFVHENVEMKLKGQLRGATKGRPGYRGHYWDPQGRGQAKFLEEPARAHAKTMRGIITGSMTIL